MPLNAPNQPTLTRNATNPTTAIDATWNDPNADETAVRLRYSTASAVDANGMLISGTDIVLPANTTTHTITGLLPNTVYYVQVRHEAETVAPSTVTTAKTTTAALLKVPTRSTTVHAALTTPDITLLSSTATEMTTAGTTLTVTRPVAAITGRVLHFAIFTVGDVTVTANDNRCVQRAMERESGQAARLYVYTLVCGASEPASYTFTLGASATASAVTTVLANVHTDVVDAAPSSAHSFGDTATVPLPLTITPKALLLGSWCIFSGSTTLTKPTQMTLEATTTTRVGVVASEVLPTAGTTGSRSATLSAGRWWYGALIAFKPLVGAAPQGTSEPVYWGTYKDGGISASNIGDQETMIGKTMSIVHFAQSWYETYNDTTKTRRAFPTSAMTTIRNRGSIPMLNWGSWAQYYYGSSSFPSTQAAFANTAITAGTFDAHITQFAQEAAAWGHPFFLKFDHEMNGTWQFPWAVRNGNVAADFVPMWQHVHTVFMTAYNAGRVNQNASVTWVWQPNIVSSATSNPLSTFYPGDAYVDWTGFHGYNFGPNTNGEPWRTPQQTYRGGIHTIQDTYGQVSAIAPTKPMMIGEWGCGENNDAGVSKRQWLLDMFDTFVPSNTLIRAVVYFNEYPENTVRIDSTATALSGFQDGIAHSRYKSAQYGSLAPGKILPPT